MCQRCHPKHCDDSSSDKECWIRCDFCWRWWHYRCGSFAGVPDSTLGENTWKCLTCKYERFTAWCSFGWQP